MFKKLILNNIMMNMLKTIRLVLIVYFITAPYFLSAQSAKEIQKSIEGFETAMKARDFEAMKSLIAPGFMVGVYEGDTKDYLLKGILKAYPEIDEVAYLDKTNKNGLTLAEVIIKEKSGKENKGNLAFNSDGLLEYVDLFDRLYQLDRYSDGGLIASIPFEMDEGKIFIELKLNNNPDFLEMIFDTGADGMALSPSAAKRMGINNTQDHESAVVGGKTNVQLSKNNTVHLNDSLVMENQNLVIFPGMSGKADGIIGGGILRNYTTRIDFDKQVIELYDFNSFEAKKDAKFLPVDFNSGLPVIPITYFLDNKDKELTANMVFDTGAGYNIIFFGPYVGKENLEEGFKAKFYSTNYSMGMATPTKMGYMDYAKLGDHKLENLLISLQAEDPDKGKWNTDAGSFGLELIKKFNVTIDRLHQRLYLEPNKNYERPTDFVLAGMVLHFNDEDELEVNQVIGGTNASSEGIKPGHKILMINDFNAEDLLIVENRFELINEENEEFTLRIQTNDQMRQVTVSK
ncbi:retropepsin-like aspartic protease [Algoriphagus halophytocola]|uniref:Retroviral-like aspartic protease family protein n=1 Tax=Algoriphagus halophytocola TaxID=2991499 RepID=A0ABY6MBY6_9BACT|nr:retropepsin-like aspartic protease [Algoriphagus sp. TR-M5]UZD21137.1 retroviral-like aspartic protease family protein [Algoriphagus sp. TR-M5]